MSLRVRFTATVAASMLFVAVRVAFAGEASAEAAPPARSRVALYVVSGGTSAAPARLAESAGGAVVVLPSATPVRTAAVGVDLGRASGIRASRGALGGWSVEAAVQEGLPQRYPRVLPWRALAADDVRGAETRIRARRILGRVDASARVAERNYDPASGLLLADAGNPLGVDVDSDGAEEVDGGIDLLRDRRVAPDALLSLRLSARHERIDPAAHGHSLLATAARRMDDLLGADDATAVAIVGRGSTPTVENGRARPSPASAIRSRSLGAVFSLAPPAEAGKQPRWHTTFGYGHREARQFAWAGPSRLSWASDPKPRFTDQKTDSHFLSAAWSREPWSLGYRFTLLSPERIGGSPALVGIALRAHQIDAAVRTSDGLALSLLVAGSDSTDERAGTELSMVDSRFGFSWSFAPRWTLSENVTWLDVNGPGAGSATRSRALDGRIARAMRVPVTAKTELDGQLFARSSFQTDVYRAPAASASRREFWAAEVGLRVTF